jgi:hypothetical protein
MSVKWFAAPQKGATLVVAMIMLLLFTLLVASAFHLSTTNLQMVGNMQVREEALASANFALEQVLESNFFDNPAAAAETIDVVINAADAGEAIAYPVTIDVPACIRASVADDFPPSSEALEGLKGISTWNTVWLLRALALDPVSGSQVAVREGVRVLMLGNVDGGPPAVCVV